MVVAEPKASSPAAAPATVTPPAAVRRFASTGARPGGADETLSYADLVLRRLAAELPGASISRVRVAAFIARIELVEPALVGRSSAFELQPDGGLVLPRTHRALDALVESAAHPLPDVVPFVSAAWDGSATIAIAPAGGRPVGVVVARRAAELHWLAPWCHEVVSVAAEAGPPCQLALDRLGCDGLGLGSDGHPRHLLVLAPASQHLDLDALRAPGGRIGRIGVLRYPDGSFTGDSVPEGRPFSAAAPAGFGSVEYVLVDELV